MARLESLSAVHEHRDWFIALGIALILLGAAAMTLPFLTALTTTLFVGVLLVLGGVVQGVHALRARRWRAAGWSTRALGRSARRSPR